MPPNSNTPDPPLIPIPSPPQPTGPSQSNSPSWLLSSPIREAIMRRLSLIVVSQNSNTAQICNAIRLILAADAQNQAEERRKTSRPETKIIVAVDKGWYGNEAHDLAALRTAASNPDSPLSGS